MKDLVIFDIETSGSNGREYDIIQIGAVKVRNLSEIVAKFDVYIKPSLPAWSGEAFNVHKLSREFLEGRGQRLETALTKFEYWVKESGKYMMAAWGTYFDIIFLKQVYERLNIAYPFYRREFCVASAVRFYLSSVGKLGKMGEAGCAKSLGISVEKEKTHNGLYDAELSAKMLIEVTHRIKHPEQRELPTDSGLSKDRLNCPECDGELVLRDSKYGRFLGCTNYPVCTVTHSIHKGSGKPTGLPADKETRTLRMKAHEVFDNWWTSKGMDRSKAYVKLSTIMDIPKDLAHIGMFDKEQCQRMIEIFKKL